MTEAEIKKIVEVSEKVGVLREIVDVMKSQKYSDQEFKLEYFRDGMYCGGYKPSINIPKSLNSKMMKVIEEELDIVEKELNNL